MNTTFISTTNTDELEHAMAECDATFLEVAFEFTTMKSDTTITQAEKQEALWKYIDITLDCVQEYIETSNE